MIITDIKPKKTNKTELARSLGVSRQSLYYKPIRETKDLTTKTTIGSHERAQKLWSQKNSY